MAVVLAVTLGRDGRDATSHPGPIEEERLGYPAWRNGQKPSERGQFFPCRREFLHERQLLVDRPFGDLDPARVVPKERRSIGFLGPRTQLEVQVLEGVDVPVC